jgi:mRNA interferase YafQ
MLEPVYRKKFKKDLHRMIKRVKTASKIKDVLEKLLKEEPLDAEYNDHKLSGKLKDFRDCHTEPDWILIYRVLGDKLILARTGTHSDLFKK